MKSSPSQSSPIELSLKHGARQSPAPLPRRLADTGRSAKARSARGRSTAPPWTRGPVMRGAPWAPRCGFGVKMCRLRSGRWNYALHLCSCFIVPQTGTHTSPSCTRALYVSNRFLFFSLMLKRFCPSHVQAMTERARRLCQSLSGEARAVRAESVDVGLLDNGVERC